MAKGPKSKKPKQQQQQQQRPQQQPQQRSQQLPGQLPPPPRPPKRKLKKMKKYQQQKHRQQGQQGQHVQPLSKSQLKKQRRLAAARAAELDSLSAPRFNYELHDPDDKETRYEHGYGNYESMGW